MTIDMIDSLREMADELGIHVEDYRKDYSGRGMFGAGTHAIVIEGGRETAHELIGFWMGRVGASSHRLRIDDMGRDSTVIY